MSEESAQEKRRPPTSIWFQPEVLAKLDEYAAAQERSRSWMVNRFVKQSLGLLPDVEDAEHEMLGAKRG